MDWKIPAFLCSFALLLWLCRRRRFPRRIWTQDRGGTVRKSLLICCPDGQLLARFICDWETVNANGSANGGFIAKWWNR